MGPESVSSQDVLPADRGAEQEIPSAKASTADSPALRLGKAEPDELNFVFFGSQGLRAGWSILVFGFLLFFSINLFELIISFLVFDVAHLRVYGATPLNTILGEGLRVAALVTAVLVVAALERRRWVDYNLAGLKRLSLFLGGLAAGFGAVSVLVGVMSGGGWMRVDPAGLAGPQLFKYALLWGFAFALVGIFEEGAFRCYLLYTFARGINFWWALASVSSICLYLLLNPKAHGAWGVYAVALAGLLPCLVLHWRETPRSSFWQAAWITSAGFGFIHTFNSGENWIGILAAAAIGFVFCVSVRVTGTAWWAIGCHASWDWAESYFYGTADSGFAARGHFLTSTPVGSTLWSGGADGPEGSLLVFPVISLLLVALFVLYGRRKTAVLNEATSERMAG
jgi:membrane protease YdiL (CAAX protease family)